MSARTLLSAAAVLSMAACVDSSSPVAPPAPEHSALPAPQFTQVVDGSTGPGSVYRLVVPDDWNGVLMVYAHGYVAPEKPVGLPDEAQLIQALLVPQGFALAYSSFSENGWSVKDGAQRTQQLLGLFTSRFGTPSRVYLGGVSMGGLVAIKLAERFPTKYRAVLAACAVAGGTQRHFDYYANVRATFDVLYPGVLPGDAAFLPPNTDIPLQILGPAAVAMGAVPAPALTLAALDQTPVPFASGPELIESIVTALGGHAASLTDPLLTRVGPYFDNRSTVYSIASVPVPAINAAVERFSASRSALATFEQNYAPSGDLRVPMLMLSNARDPVVPGFHQAAYLAAVTANGAQDLLVQREVPAYGHCEFSPAELGAAVADLIAWGEFGIKPAP